jgi:hypothetical protein
MAELPTSKKLDPPWQGLAIIGAILIGQTFTDFGWKGPWNDVSFTQGSLGLVGGILLYLAWFRWHFKMDGLIPTLDRWKDLKKGMTTLFICTIIMCIFTTLVGGPFSEYFPRPSGMILGLISLLMVLQLIYAWLNFNNYFSEEE